MAQNQVVLVGSYFKHGRRAAMIGAKYTPTGIEETGVVRAEFSGGGIEGHHFTGEVSWDHDAFACGKNIETILFEAEKAGIGLL